MGPLSLVKDFFKNIWGTPEAGISEHPLGKYIILAASCLHSMWGTLVIISDRALQSTPLATIYQICGQNRTLVIELLWFVSIAALGFLNARLRQNVHVTWLSILLIPQQTVLWFSAGGGILAVMRGHYADGTVKSSIHILTDQLPVIMIAILYTIALFKSRSVPRKTMDRKYVFKNPT
jgi:hypothetical protein